jgi:penicillin-insensitive murein endopeptidase
MMQALVRAAGVVAEAFPESELTINDLSRREGGPLPHHGSHQAGRDVDVLFYYLDAEGEPMRSKGVPVDPDGRGFDFGDLSDPADDVPMRIDIPRTWRFLEALVDEERTYVQRIFVVEHVREMLLAHARRVRAPSRAIQRIDQMTCQPSHPHDDHMHIRFFCTAEDIRDGGCKDTYPLYGWHRRAIRADGETPVIERRRGRTGVTPAPTIARTVSRAEARERAGPMHRRVREWLDRREAWAEKPSPGRPFCR